MAPSAITAIETTVSRTTTYSVPEKLPHLALNGVSTPKELIGEALTKRVEEIDTETCEPGDEDTFFVADLGEVYRQHMRWKMNLKRVKPFYGTFIAVWHVRAVMC